MVKHASSSPFSVLRHRTFATFWFAAVVSDIGTWMQAIAVGALVAKLTGKASSTGLITIAAFVPQGIISPIGGVLADRFDRRHMVLFSQSGQIAATTALGVALLADRPSVALLTTLVFLQGIIGAFGMPASQSLMPDLVPKDELLKAVSLGAVSWNSGRIVGSLLVALLGVWLSPSLIAFCNAASFVVFFFAILSVRRPFRAERHADTGFIEELRNGAIVLWRTPGCRYAVIALGLFQLTLVPWVGLVAIVAQERLGGDRQLASVLTMLHGLGAIAGSVLISWMFGAIGRPRALLVAFGTGIVALTVYSQVTDRRLAYLPVFVLGACTLSGFVGLSGVVQRDAPYAARSRILSIQGATLGTCYGIGVIVTGWLGDHIGLGSALALNAASAALLLGLSLIAGRRLWSIFGKGDPVSRRWERRLNERLDDVHPMP